MPTDKGDHFLNFHLDAEPATVLSLRFDAGEMPVEKTSSTRVVSPHGSRSKQEGK